MSKDQQTACIPGSTESISMSPGLGVGMILHLQISVIQPIDLHEGVIHVLPNARYFGTFGY